MAKKRGRPKGSKNRSTLERENAEAAARNGEGDEEIDEGEDTQDQEEGRFDPTTTDEDKSDLLGASEEIGRSDKATGLRFELVEDEDGEWHWMLFARNGRPVATNVEPYDRRNDAERSIGRFVDDARAARRRILVRLS